MRSNRRTEDTGQKKKKVTTTNWLQLRGPLCPALPKHGVEEEGKFPFYGGRSSLEDTGSSTKSQLTEESSEVSLSQFPCTAKQGGEGESPPLGGLWSPVIQGNNGLKAPYAIKQGGEGENPPLGGPRSPVKTTEPLGHATVVNGHDKTIDESRDDNKDPFPAKLIKPEFCILKGTHHHPDAKFEEVRTTKKERNRGKEEEGKEDGKRTVNVDNVAPNYNPTAGYLLVAKTPAQKVPSYKQNTHIDANKNTTTTTTQETTTGMENQERAAGTIPAHFLVKDKKRKGDKNKQQEGVYKKARADEKEKEKGLNTDEEEEEEERIVGGPTTEDSEMALIVIRNVSEEEYLQVIDEFMLLQVPIDPDRTIYNSGQRKALVTLADDAAMLRWDEMYEHYKGPGEIIASFDYEEELKEDTIKRSISAAFDRATGLITQQKWEEILKQYEPRLSRRTSIQPVSKDEYGRWTKHQVILQSEEDAVLLHGLQNKIVDQRWMIAVNAWWDPAQKNHDAFLGFVSMEIPTPEILREIEAQIGVKVTGWRSYPNKKVPSRRFITISFRSAEDLEKVLEHKGQFPLQKESNNNSTNPQTTQCSELENTKSSLRGARPRRRGKRQNQNSPPSKSVESKGGKRKRRERRRKSKKERNRLRKSRKKERKEQGSLPKDSEKNKWALGKKQRSPGKYIRYILPVLWITINTILLYTFTQTTPDEKANPFFILKLPETTLSTLINEERRATATVNHWSFTLNPITYSKKLKEPQELAIIQTRKTKRKKRKYLIDNHGGKKEKDFFSTLTCQIIIRIVQEIAFEVIINQATHLLQPWLTEIVLAIAIFAITKKHSNGYLGALLLVGIYYCTNLPTANAGVIPLSDVTIASVNANCNTTLYSALQRLAMRLGWGIIAIQETGLTKSTMGPPKAENRIKLEGYVPYWNNPSTKRLLRNYKNKEIRKAGRRLAKGKIDEQQYQNKIESIASKATAYGRGGMGFLIKEELVEYCRTKVLYKKDKGKRKERKNTRLYLLKIKINGKTLRVLSLYLPSGNIVKNERFCNKYLVSKLNVWEKGNKPYVLIGDFNTTLREGDRWTNRTRFHQERAHTFFTTQNEGEEGRFLDEIAKNNNELGWTYSKVSTKGGSKTITYSRIDHVLTSLRNEHSPIKDAYIEEDHSLATDHNPVCCTIEMEKSVVTNKQADPEAFTRKYYDKRMTEKKEKKFQKKLEKEWEKVPTEPINDENVQRVYQAFCTAIHTVAEKVLGCIARKEKSKKNHKPVIGNYEYGLIKKQRKNLLASLKEMKRSLHKGVIPMITAREGVPTWEPGQDKQEWLCRVETRVKKNTNKLKQLKWEMEGEQRKEALNTKQKEFKSGQRKWWRWLSNNAEQDSEILEIQVTNEKGEKRKSSDEGTILTTVWTFWQTLYKMGKEWDGSIPQWMIPTRARPPTYILTKEITINEIEQMIKDAPNTSPGRDGISVGIIKHLPKNYLDFLVRLFNHCIQGGKIPEEWKDGQITVIYKEGPKYKPENYRPIMLLQNIYKLYSGLLTIRLSAFANKYILHVCQHGFREGRSTIDCCRVYKEILEDSKKRKKEIHAVYLDIKKAFDSVQWWQIIEALEHYNVDKKYISAIQQIYSNRRAKIKVNRRVTDWIDINQGTAQGDPLSPLLFIISINPLLEWIHEKERGYKLEEGPEIRVLAYCDDLLLLAETREQISNTLNRVEEWGSHYGIKINPKKSAYGYNHCNTVPAGLRVESGKIKSIGSTGTYKYLGIHFNMNLNWTKQKEILEKKYKRKVYQLTRKRLNYKQAILAINMIANAYVAYSLGIGDYENEWLNQLDNLALECTRRVARTWGAGDAGIFTPADKGGLGLQKLSTLQGGKQLAMTTAQLNNKSLASLVILSTITDETKDSRTIKEWREALRMVGMKANIHYTNTPELKNLIKDTELNIDIEMSGLKYLAEVTVNGRLKSRAALATSTLKSLSEGTWEKIRETLCQGPTTHLRPEYKQCGKKESIKTKNARDPTQWDLDKDGYALAYTDGSFKTIAGQKIVTSAVYFKEGSKLNTTFSTVGRTKSSYLGEIAAIECALKTLPPETSIRIVTDSKSAQKAIAASNSKRWSRKKWAPAKDYIRRIKKRMREKERVGGVTELVHIYSHVEDKIKMARKKGNRKGKEMIKRIEKQKELHGESWNTYVAGNTAADKLAGREEALGNIVGHTECRDVKQENAIIRDQNDNIVQENLNKKYKQIVGKRMKKKFVNYPSRGAVLRNKETDQKASIKILTRRRGKKTGTQLWSWRARHRFQYTRDQQYHKFYKGKGDDKEPRNLPDFHKGDNRVINTLTGIKTYQNQECMSCNQQSKENMYHILSGECDARHSEQAEIAEKVRDYLQERTGSAERIINRLPLWIPDPYPPSPLEEPISEEWRRLSEYPKELGAMGMCPIVLRTVIRDLCKDKNKGLAEDIVEGAIWLIVKENRVLYHSRCKEQTEATRRKEYKREARKEVARMKGD